MFFSNEHDDLKVIAKKENKNEMSNKRKIIKKKKTASVFQFRFSETKIGAQNHKGE